MRAALLTVLMLLMSTAATPAAGQDVDRLIRQVRRAATESESTRGQVERYVRLARSLVTVLPTEDLKRLARLESRPLLKALVRMQRRVRQRQDAAFLARLDADEARAVRALPAAERRRRLDTMRADAAVESAVTTAMKHGLLTDEDAEDLRARPLKERLAAVADLNKRVFLHVHGGDLEPRERKQIEALNGARFWRHPIVRRYKLRRDIATLEIRGIRRLDGALQARFLDDLEAGRSLGWLARRGTLDEKTASRLEELEPEARLRLRRELERFHLNRTFRFTVPREFRRQLTRGERRAMSSMTDQDLVRFLERRFPGVRWKAWSDVWRRRRQLDEQLARLFKPWEIRRLRNAPRQEAVAMVRRRVREPDRLLALMERTGFHRKSRRGGPLLSANEAATLTPNELRELGRQGVVRQIIFVAERFPQTWGLRVERFPSVTGVLRPEGWETMSARDRVTHLVREVRNPRRIATLLSVME